MSYDWIIYGYSYLLQLCFQLATLNLKERMVSFVALDEPNPALQIGAAPNFVI